MGVHHNIEIVFIKKMKYEYCITNRFVGEKYNWIFPNSVTGFTFKPEEKLFAFFRNPEEDFGTNIFPISMTLLFGRIVEIPLRIMLPLKI